MRSILLPEKIHPAIHKKIGGDQTIVIEVQEAIARNAVVIVGMAQNPAVKSARKLLTENNTEFTYLEYGSYFSMWRKRLPIKMWTGFVTFPQVFVNGVLVGGASDLKALIKSGEFADLLKA